MIRLILSEEQLRLIYRSICKIYNLVVTIFENIFYRKSIGNIKVINRGYFSIRFNKTKLDALKNPKKLKKNDYLNIYLLKKNNIENLVKNIFNYECRNYISSITGFNYSIDYIIMYDRNFIERSNRDKSILNLWYSYKWHFDKPNSNNTLKIIYPINISSKHGPLKVIDTLNSKNIGESNISSFNKKGYKFSGLGDRIHGFFPAKCLHKDGIPMKGKTATQIMFQLNPSLEWSINCKLNQRDPNLNNKLKIWTNEPKFTFLTSLFDNRIRLSKLIKEN